MMQATAQSTIQTASPLLPLVDGGGNEIPEPYSAEFSAVTESPEDLAAIGAFVRVLEKLDPAEPRSDSQTAALVAAISSGQDLRKVQGFVERSLVAEISALFALDGERLRLPQGTLLLLNAFLYNYCSYSMVLEPVLITLRQGLLDFSQTSEAPAADRIDLAEAMARHSFTNEYIWEETDFEAAAVSKLIEKVSHSIETGANVSAFDLFVIGAYRPLDTIDQVQKWVMQLGHQDLSALDPTLRLLVFNPLIEKQLKISRITPVTDEVSSKVSAQYEENPYPRWRHMPQLLRYDGLKSYVSHYIAHSGKMSPLNPSHPKVLVAGSGTGRHPIALAKELPSASVLAIDLSRASLSYATREAAERGVKNVEFAQADILKLAGANVEFDLIESVGVLHHMADPEAGLRSLVGILKPGGYLRLGLYSRIARRGVTIGRELLASGEYAPGLAGIRALRHDVLNSSDPELASLSNFADFYSASMFRDLVMHAQEHQFVIPEIEAMLKRNGLKFLGFSTTSAVSALKEMPAKMAQRRVRDLKAWDRYEKRNPDTFTAMYQFFCMKR